MGDVGDAFSSGLSSLGSGIGNAFSGLGSMFGGGGDMSGMGSLMSGVSNMMGGGSASPTQTAAAVTQAADPTGSVGATQAINQGQPAPTQQGQGQGQNQNQNQNQSQQNQQQQDRQKAIQQLEKELQQQAKGKQGNPYQPGGGAGAGGGEGGQGGPKVPQGQPAPEGAQGGAPPPEGDWLGQYSRDAGFTPSPWQGQGTGGAPSSPAGGGGSGGLPAATQAAGQAAAGGATTQGQGPPAPAPEIGPGSAAAAGGLPSLAKGAVGGLASIPLSATPAQTGELPPGGYSLPSGQGGIGSDAVASQRGPAWATGQGVQQYPEPSTGSVDPSGRPVADPNTGQLIDPRTGTPIGGPGGQVQPQQQGPRDQRTIGMPPPRYERGERAPGTPEGLDTGETPTKSQYQKWLEKQGVKPDDAKKRADNSTPADRQKAAPAPAGGGEGPPAPGGRGVSRMMRDVSGRSTGAPAMLGELAQMVMPLLGGLLGGGMGGLFGGRHGFRGFPFGRGGHGRFGAGRMGGGYRGGHPGGFGSGMWPYHNPTMGWRGFGFHPGGNWRPLNPMFGPGGGGMGMGGGGGLGGDGDGNQLPPWLQQLLGGGQGQGGQGQGPQAGWRGQGGPGGGQGPQGGNWNAGGTAPSTTPGKGPNGQPLPYSGQQAADFTRQVASQLGVDPDKALAVLRAESNFGQGYSNLKDPGAGSFGPFQLDIAPGALGQAFMNETGEDPRNPATWQDQIVYALRYIQNRGWGPWTTAQRFGFGKNQPGGDPGKRFAWDYGKGGQNQTAGNTTTKTGDTKAPTQVDFAGNPLTSAGADVAANQ